jgi:hypothetical protein
MSKQPTNENQARKVTQTPARWLPTATFTTGAELLVGGGMVDV